MQTAPDLATDLLADRLRADYGIDATQITFWPHGEGSYGFVATAGRERVYLKVYDPQLPSQRQAVERAGHVLPLLRELDALGLPVAAPHTTRAGRLVTEIGRFRVVVFDVIEGRTLGEKPWDGGVYGKLGRTVGRLHGLTDRLRRLLPDPRPIEIPTRAEVEALLAAIEAAVDSPRPTRRRLATEVLPRRQDLLRHHARLTELSGRVQASMAGWVLCHADLTGHNLIASHADVSLIDWDGVRLAPREMDVAFFADEPFDQTYGVFLGAYGEVCRPALDVDAFLFCMYQRNLEDVVEGVRFVLEQDAVEEELDHALTVALEDGVYDWPGFAAGERKHRDAVARWQEIAGA